MADTPKHSVSVAGIVVDHQDRVLVIQRRDNGHWEPPGGVLELDETLEAGIVREAFEETGVDVRVECSTGVYKNMKRAIVALVFRCTPMTDAVSVSDEARSVEWRSVNDVIRDMDSAYSIRVTEAFLAGVQPRVHDGLSVVV